METSPASSSPPQFFRRISSVATPYLVALLLVLGAFLARYSLGPRFGTRSALDLFLVPVAVSAWLGGIGPAILAFVSSLLLGLWYFIPPEESFWITELVDAVETASFVFASTIISVIIHLMKRATRRARKSASEAIQKQAELEQEVGLRRHAERNLQVLNAELESRVIARTSELVTATEAARKSAEEVIERHTELTQEVKVRRQVEQELQTLNAKLEDRVVERTVELRGALKELESYSYTIAHNLRAPLRGVAGIADIIEQEAQVSEEGKAHLSRIRQSMFFMDALIQGLLEYSRVSREEFVRQPLALEPLLEEALKREQSTLDSRKARIEVLRPLPPVMGDRRAMIAVLSQLLSNAAKFVPPERTPDIHVYAEQQGNRVRLWVQDNGIGIEPRHREQIFRVFERLHGPESYPGTGIGLALARRCMERMGGNVGVDSVPGQGSRFWIEADASGE